MKKFGLGLAMAVVMAFGAGCSAKLETTFEPPQEYPIDNSRIFNASYDVVWKATIDSVGSSFFVLENIEKDSGILSLSFSVKKPSDYVDCGVVSQKGKDYYGKEYQTTFLGAETPVKRMIVLPDRQMWPVYREITLSGKANILVQALSKNTTKVSINTRYVLDLVNTVSYQVYVGGFSTIPQSQTIKQQMSFTGNELGQIPGAPTDQVLKCYSKFTLEQQILDGIEAKL